MATKKLSKKIDEAAGTVTFGFSDESTLVLSLDQLDDVIKRRACLHGISQKVGDAAAGVEAVGDMFKACKAVIEQLVKGVFNIKREGGGIPRTSLLVEALVRITGKTHEEIMEGLEGMEDSDIKDIRADSNVRTLMAQIRFEREQAKAKEEQKEGALDLAALVAKGQEAAQLRALEEEEEGETETTE